MPDVLVRNRIHGRVKGFAYESIRSFVDCLAENAPDCLQAHLGVGQL